MNSRYQRNINFTLIMKTKLFAIRGTLLIGLTGLLAGAQAATFTVLNTSDAGPGSLRQAMLDANANPGGDVIEFAIGGGGAQTIVLQSALPLLGQSILIDGATQPLFSGTPLITLDAAAVGTGLHLYGAANSLIRAIAIENAQNVAIQLQSVNDSSVVNVSASWNGSSQTGIGVNLYQGARNRIEQVTALNRQTGISIFFADSTLLQDNHLSGAITGISAGGLGNKFFGNDLSFASSIALSIAQDSQFQIAGNDFSHSASGLSLYDIDGLVASPNPGPGQISMDVSTIPGVGLWLAAVRNSQVSGLVLSWDGQNLGGWNIAPHYNVGVFVHGGFGNQLSSIVAAERNVGAEVNGSSQNILSDLDLTWSGAAHQGVGVRVTGSDNTIQRVISPRREVGIQVTGNSNLIEDNLLSGAVSGITGIGLGNKFFGNDLSFASSIALSIAQDSQFQIAGNDFSHSASGLSLYDIDGLVASPNPGPGQISMDVSTIPGVGLWLAAVRNSHFSGLVLSWNGENVGGWTIAPGRNRGLFLNNCPNTTISTFVVKQREVGISLASQHAVVECSTVQDNQFGIRVDINDPTGVIIRESDISGNSSGGLIAPGSVAAVVAENNYWGAADGPAPIGSGNSFSGNADVEPFLTGPPACLGGADQEPPVVACLPPVTVAFNGVPAAARSAAEFIAQGGTISDDRDPNPSVTSLDVVSGYCPMLITRTYTVSDASGNSAVCDQLITVENLFAEDGIIWHQPLARHGTSEDTDPSARGTLKYRFKLGSTIPIEIHALGCGGTHVTANAGVIGKVEIFGDTNCDGAADGNAQPIEFNGVGEAGGVMDEIGGHLQFNLDTRKLPQTAQCYLLQVTVTDTSTGESRSEIVPLQAR